MAIVTITDTTVTGTGTAPDAPTNLTTETEWDAVRLHWDNPSQRDVDYIQIWRATVNNRASATMVAQVKANDYTDHSLETGTRYYWIRAISTTGLTSAYHPSSATAGVSGIPDQVAITSPANNHVLQYDSATNSWVNGGIRDATRLKGAIESTRNDSFVVPPSVLNTVTANNGFDIFSNADASNNGYGAQCSLTNYTGDTAAGLNTSSSFQLRGALGTATAPLQSGSTDVMGTINFSGYSGTGFTSYVASQNQGGGMVAFHPLQIQSLHAETPVESSFSLANAVQSGNGILRQVLTIGSVSSSGAGVFTCTSGDIRRNDVVRVTGTISGGTWTGYADGNLYYVTAGGNPTTSFTLSATPGGAPVATTTGITGLTFIRYRVLFNYATQTVAPFGINAKVTIAGTTTAKFDGTAYVVFSTTTGTGVGMYIAAAGNQTGAAGTIGLTNVTGAATLRIRSFPVGQPMTTANRVSLIEHNSSTATYRTDTFTLQQGSTTTNHLVVNSNTATLTPELVIANANTTRGGAGYASMIAMTNQNAGATNINKYIRLNSTGGLEVVNSAYSAVIATIADNGDFTAGGSVTAATGFFKYPVYTKAALTAITGQVGWTAAVSDSAQGSNPNGMLAFWDTTNARWSYIHDNSAV